MSEREKWLEWRQKGIGASDAAALYDVHPHMTKLGLFKIKSQPEYKEEENSFIKQRGNDLEAKARIKFAAILGMAGLQNEPFDPKAVELSSLPFIRASLDGSSRDGKKIVEFKFMSEPVEEGKELTPGQKKHLAVIDESLPIKGGRVPLHFWIQCQHQLLASGAEVCYFASFDGQTLHTCRIEPDLDFQSNHIKVCTDFWKSVQEGMVPPPSVRDYVELKNPKLKAKIRRWKTLLNKSAKTKENLDALREDILKDITHPLNICAGVSIVKCKGKAGAIDYPKIMSLPGVMALKIDPEQYRKPEGTPYWKMEIEK